MAFQQGAYFSGILFYLAEAKKALPYKNFQ